MTVRIDPRSIQPDVIIPERLPKPKHVNICLLFESRPWKWKGDNVSLIRPRSGASGPKRISEALTWLEVANDMHGIRALNAGEMTQIMHDKSHEIPVAWQQSGFGGRIFWAGSIYRLVYPDESLCDMIAYCWYEDAQWRRAYIEEDAPLRPSDEFAVVPARDGDLIPDVTEAVGPYNRRKRFRPRYRPF